MFLQEKLLKAAAGNAPVRVCLIGAGKFGSMFLSQVPTTPGLVVTRIADLRPDAARSACRTVGWDEARVDAVKISDDAPSALAADDVDVVVEATGNPHAGVRHARAAIAAGKHVVMVNVEADVFAGAALAREARAAGMVYSMAYGDQPALTAEIVDWARSCGFDVVCAGKGTKYRPHYHQSTPETVWEYMGFDPDQAVRDGMNPRMFNSFTDGTKSSLEMAAIANACGLTPPADGLLFPPCGVDDLAHILRPASEGGVLEAKGMVETVSSEERDGRPVFRDLRWGVYAVFEAPNDYAAGCFRQYGMNTDASGRYSAMYKPFHLIGMELNVSILSAALLGQATGETRAFNGDVVATAKRDLTAGETLDGEGGYCVWGKLVPAARSVREALLPIGLADRVKLARDVKAGATLGYADVAIPEDNDVAAYRRAMERTNA
ncbi:Gfo/Idh/MocA family oxidoreductase [Pikeienuella piscinae]|uniref:Gfo/Idh/MocA family oxidoreductase n=1 Tax=Pikeienuella piscinae TaxID=2748098 RepID=A0A7L5BVU8_9RHOB|nr:Gfo/Idh/MocA family oxidoreductase [Pikeienuella piscinae]QIE55892.1 Gfo/Idh/MocA family oxidoreductase [Pikeienuella piscinae]